MSDAPTRQIVTVAVCTFRRNDLLISLVHTVDRLVATEAPDASVGMLVVDDSPEGDAAETVEALRDHVGVALTYGASAAADISIARNYALQRAAQGSNFVACLDDDCVPHEGWLRELLRVADGQQADIVVGHRQFVAATTAPRWLRRQPFLAENLHYADGSVPVSGNTANMLVRSSWLSSSGVSFRSEMGAVGGEDMVFFADAEKVGANIRFSSGSVCDEPCDGKRATFRYQAWRQVWLGNNEAVINRTTRQFTHTRMAVRGTKRVVFGLTHPVVQLLRRQSPQLHWAVALTGSGIGQTDA